jgi:DNA polymerase (family 10)
MNGENRRVAAQLDELASLLELAGAGYYRVRAYRSAAAAVRALSVPIGDLVREGRARELPGIGPAVEARLHELLETGELAEVARLRESTAVELTALGRLLGLGPGRGAAIGEALGVRTVAELEQAAQQGRLRDVPGIGPKTEAKIRAALARRAGPPRRGLTISHARSLTTQIAEALGGIAAGDPRRWLEESRRLAVVVPSNDPAHARKQFAALPEIVTMIDADRGVTVDGVPIELIVAAPGSLGPALLRATGPSEYVSPLEPLPDGEDEARSIASSGAPTCRQSSAESGATGPSRRCSSRSLRCVATCTATPSGRTAGQRCSRWQRPRGAGATNTSRSATTRPTSVLSRVSTRTRCAGRPWR